MYIKDMYMHIYIYMYIFACVMHICNVCTYEYTPYIRLAGTLLNQPYILEQALYISPPKRLAARRHGVVGPLGAAEVAELGVAVEVHQDVGASSSYSRGSFWWVSL